RNSPDFNLVKRMIAKVESAEGECSDVKRIPRRGHISRLGIVRMIVVAAGMARHISLERDLGGLVAPDARLRAPQWKAPSAQIKVGELLASTPDVLVRVGNDTQPKSVHGSIKSPQHQRIALERNGKARGLPLAGGKQDRFAIDLGMRQRTAFGKAIL